MERDPRDYYNDLPGKIPPEEKNKLVIDCLFFVTLFLRFTSVFFSKNFV